MLANYKYGDAVVLKKLLNFYAVNDVVYFEYPSPDSIMTKTFLLQRIVALPGDSLIITDKVVYVNGKYLDRNAGVKHNYFIKAKGKLDSSFCEKYNLFEGGEISDKLDYSYTLTRTEYETLKDDTMIVSIERKSEKTNTPDENCFPYSLHYPWNLDHYGKLYLPKINDTLKLDTVSIHLYSGIIHDHEKNDLQVRQDSILINGELCRSYVVKKNYYFVLGDNRDNAIDSRTWGFLPESQILGKIIYPIRRAQ